MQKSMHRAEITCFIVQRPVLKRGQFVLESGISESFAQRFDSFRFTMYYEGSTYERSILAAEKSSSSFLSAYPENPSILVTLARMGASRRRWKSL